ncbi:hypothetical protein DAPPUDRAFT_120376 [Daphnia pulex]|uniref:Uncharacterized protein n=1 Tax=Daphnia pulex TaxID=6669 RepID=E9I158_DAPPU|nr:hypothetical protein DAPPUDRAFT_120376 [Daphnia pulex]|eukprot:EFX62270.1 hypothetical protein DAPPUDRAFT_120376 [Daphnia pulex]
MRNDYELGNFAVAIQHQKEETKSRRGTMMSWIAFVAIQRRKDETNNRRGQPCRGDPASNRRNKKSTMTSELDSLYGDPAAKRRNEKYTMNDYELDNFAKVIQQQQTDETKGRRLLIMSRTALPKQSSNKRTKRRVED